MNSLDDMRENPTVAHFATVQNEGRIHAERNIAFLRCPNLNMLESEP